MRVLVFGSRTFDDWRPIHTVLEGYLRACVEVSDTLGIIEGGARGADRFAREFFDGQDGRLLHDNIYHETYPADWKNDGRSAGPKRNRRMARLGEPDVAWGFVDKPLANSVGSYDMAQVCLGLSIPTYIVQKL